MVVLAYLWSQCTKYHTAGWMCWFLLPFILSRVSGLMRLRDGSDKRTARKRQILCKMRWRPWKRLDKHSRKKAWAIYMGAWMARPNSTRPKKADRWREKSRASHYLLWHRGDCSERIGPGRPNSQFRILWCFMVTPLKCAKTSPWNFSNKRTGCCIKTMHCLTLPFPPGNFWPKTAWLSSLTHPTRLAWGGRGRIPGGAEQQSRKLWIP
jgi:hypothetical protein